MGQWNQGYLVDVFSHADVAIFENDGVEADAERGAGEPETQETQEIQDAKVQDAQYAQDAEAQDAQDAQDEEARLWNRAAGLWRRKNDWRNNEVGPEGRETGFAGGKSGLFDSEAVEEHKKKWNKKKITVITGIAVGSAALTGAIVTVCVKNCRPKRAI